MAEEINNNQNQQKDNYSYLDSVNLNTLIGDVSNLVETRNTTSTDPVVEPLNSNIQNNVDTPKEDTNTDTNTNTNNSNLDNNNQGDTDKNNQEDPSSSENKGTSPFFPYAKLVKEEGILPNFDIEDWDGKPEGLIKGMQHEIESGINQYKESFDPRIKWLADNYDAGVPLESLLNIDKQRFNLQQITEESLNEENTQKDIVKQYYKETTSFSDKAIDKAIERLEATGDLPEESKLLYEELKTINIAKEQQYKKQAEESKAALEQQQLQQLQQFKDNLSKTEEIIPGVKLNTGIRDKIYNGMTTPVAIDNTTGQPINEIQQAFIKDPQLETKLAYLYYATKGFTNYSVFNSAGKKSAIKEFENAVSNIDYNTGTKQYLSNKNVNEDLIAQMSMFSQK